MVPQMLSADKIESMRPREKQNYIDHLILEILKRNPRGVTIAELQSKTPFSRNTFMEHLGRLVATRQASRIYRGKVSIYYRNGSVQNAMEIRDIADPNHVYSVMQLLNEDGNFIYVQEKEIDESRTIRVKGGIMINAKTVVDFLSKLQDFTYKMGAD
jgi:predicted transcriptional regulator